MASDRLIYMADQIARNFAALGHDHAVDATADHIASFWDPRIKAQIKAVAQENPELLTDAVRRAVHMLGSTSSQTEATVSTALTKRGIRTQAG